MNKKEVLEIRKQYTPEKCSITRICGCYVGGETEDCETRNIMLEMKEAFLSLPEEDAFKYFSIFRQTLSGTLGRNLLGMEFPLEQEAEGGTQEFLLRLRNSRLQDDMLIEEFYQKVIANYDYPENYYIIIIHVAYDIPGKSSDGSEMFDASEDVYEYLLCSLCPVKLSKAGLSYHADTNSIENRIRDWVVEAPVKGFLFPAFNDRSCDIHSVLYYSKMAEDLQPEFIDKVLGCVMPLSAESQKETFNMIIEDTIGEDCDYSVVKNIHEHLSDMLEENQDSPTPVILTKPDVKRLLELSGVSEEKMEMFERTYEAAADEKTEFLATNIVSGKKFNIETPDVTIKVNPDRTDLVDTRIIDGKQCLVITVNDHIEVNGVNVRTILPPTLRDDDDFHAPADASAAADSCDTAKLSDTAEASGICDTPEIAETPDESSFDSEVPFEE